MVGAPGGQSKRKLGLTGVAPVPLRFLASLLSLCVFWGVGGVVSGGFGDQSGLCLL